MEHILLYITLVFLIIVVAKKKSVYNYPLLMGDHTGYQAHFKWFGKKTKATPDGRFSGEPLSYGISQTLSKARNGIHTVVDTAGHILWTNFEKNRRTILTIFQTTYEKTSSFSK